MARPKEHGERVNTAIRFPVELHARLQEAAADREVGMNWLVNRAVEEFLDHLLPTDQIRLTFTDAELAERRAAQPKEQDT